LESIDVDIVCAQESVYYVREIIESRCNWILTDRQLGDDSWAKFAKKLHGYEDEYIYLDLLTSNFSNVFHEDRNKNLPYTLCFENDMYEFRLIDNRNYKIPIKELLILLKLKAYRDRSYNLLRAKDQKQKMYFESKRIKDISDTLALVDPGYGPIDTSIIGQIIKKYELYFITESIENIKKETEAINRYRNMSLQDVEPWIDRILSDLSYYFE